MALNPRLARAVLLLLCAAAIHCGAHAQSRVNPVDIRFITFNVDFNKTAQKIQADVTKVLPHADIIMFQEAKWVNLASFVNADWYVYQVTNQGDAKQGSAIAYRKSVVTQRISTGIVLGVAREPGMDLLDRYMNYMDVRLTNNQVIRLIALHMPPQRYVELQTPMANNLATLANGTSHPVIVGADWNFTVNNDPRKIKQKTGLEPKGIGIDGFFYDTTATSFTSLTEMTSLNVASDHDPVQMILKVYNVSSQVLDWSCY